MEKNLRILITIGCLAAVFLLTFTMVSILDLRGQVRVNALAPDETFLNSSPLPVSHAFSFQNGTMTISTALNSSVYHGAKTTDKRVLSKAGVPPGYVGSRECPDHDRGSNPG